MEMIFYEPVVKDGTDTYRVRHASLDNFLDVLNLSRPAACDNGYGNRTGHFIN